MHLSRLASTIGTMIALVGCGSAASAPGVASGTTASGTSGSGGTSSTSGVGGGSLAPLCGAGASAPGVSETGPAWYKQIGGPLDEESMAIAVDQAGSVIVAGSSNGTTDLGGGPTQLIGTSDLFVAKYDEGGAYEWTRRFGSDLVVPTDVAVDGAGNIVVLGQYMGGPLALGGPPLDATGKSESDIFVLMLDANGSPRWSRRVGGGDENGIDLVGRVAVGPDGRVALAGGYYKVSFLAELSPQGDPIFAGAFGMRAGVGALRIDGHGDIFVTGADGGADLGGGYTSVTTGVYVAKYSGKDGAYLWSKQYASSSPNGDDYPDGTGLAVLGDDIVIAGSFSGDIDLGGGSLSKSCGATVGCYLARISGADGAHRWSRAIPSPYFCTSARVSIDPKGHVVLVANLYGPTDLGSGVFAHDGTFAATYDAATGDFISGRQLVEVGTIAADTQNGWWGLGTSAIDGKGHVVVETSFFDMVTYGGASHTSAGWGDVLLAHLTL
jgi:hypothetical protein